MNRPFAAALASVLLCSAAPLWAQDAAAPVQAAAPVPAAPVGWEPHKLTAPPEEVAAAALAAAPVWDGHNDVPIQLRGRFHDLINNFDFTDTTHAGNDGKGSGEHVFGPSMHTDLARLARGHVGAQFWSVYVSADQTEPEAVRSTLEQIDVLKRLVARYPERLALALSADDVQAAMAEGRVASLMGMEGGHSIGSSLGALRQMYALGVRYMTLTHTKNNPWADSATDKPEHDGLTDFGKLVVREMNRIGMLVDLSHVSEATMMDALDVAQAPVIFSHSGARSVNPHVRNVPDAVLDRLRANGGIVMAITLPAFVSEARRQWGARQAGEEARLKTLSNDDKAQIDAGLEEWKRSNPEPVVTIGEVADHIEHIARRIGVEHIGIGGDYDGMPKGPEGMEDVSGYPELFIELARRGFSQAELEMIASRNMMRVLRAAEDYAHAHSIDPPIEYPVPD